jgi:hypothetical protein
MYDGAEVNRERRMRWVLPTGGHCEFPVVSQFHGGLGRADIKRQCASSP